MCKGRQEVFSVHLHGEAGGGDGQGMARTLQPIVVSP